jgi:hypothetical protein
VFNKQQQKNMELFVALKIMNYRPTNDYGLYKFAIGEFSGQVEFKPMVNREHAFILLDKLSELGYDYSVECISDNKVTEENVFEQQGYNIYMKNRDEPKSQAIQAEGKSLYECIMQVAVQAARLID